MIPRKAFKSFFDITMIFWWKAKHQSQAYALCSSFSLAPSEFDTWFADAHPSHRNKRYLKCYMLLYTDSRVRCQPTQRRVSRTVLSDSKTARHPTPLSTPRVNLSNGPAPGVKNIEKCCEEQGGELGSGC